MHRIPAGVCASIALACLTSGAQAQSLRGHTIESRFTVQTPNGQVNYNNLIYISAQGDVFDYSAGQQGSRGRSGQWFAGPSGTQARYVVARNSLTTELRTGRGTLRTTTTVRGSDCTVSQSGFAAGPVTTLFCQVTPGRRER